MRKFIFAILLIHFKMIGQDVGKIKSLDTVYIYIKKTDSKNKINFRNAGNKFKNWYVLTEQGNKYIGIWTTNSEHSKSTVNIVVSRKCFFAKNKENIIDMDFINRYGLQVVFIDILKVKDKKKVIYFINEKDMKKRKIVLEKATIDYSYFEEE